MHSESDDARSSIAVGVAGAASQVTGRAGRRSTTARPPFLAAGHEGAYRPGGLLPFGHSLPAGESDVRRLQVVANVVVGGTTRSTLRGLAELHGGESARYGRRAGALVSAGRSRSFGFRDQAR